MTSSAAGGRGSLCHDVLFHDSPEQLTAGAAPFLLRGLEAGDAAIVAAGAATSALLRDAVDDDPRVHVLERHDLYRDRTPAAIIMFRRLAEQYASDGIRRVRVVGEMDFGPTEREWVEWQRYEAVVNEALAGWPLWGLCLYDTRRLPEPVVESGRRTHRNLVRPDGREPNPDFVEPADYIRALPVPPEPLEATLPRLVVTDVSDFVALRHAVAAELAALPGRREAVEDFLLAVDEMTSNAARHGGPPVSVRLWSADDRVVCAIHDSGGGLDDPFAGYGPAHGEDLSRGGMGLWLARQLCDHVDIVTGADGVTVRLTSRPN